MIDSSFLFDSARRLYANISYKNKSGNILLPLRYIFETTYRCNLNCQFCYLGQEKQIKKEELSTEQWLNIIEQIPRYGFISFLGGEVFLRNDMMTLFKYCSKRVFGKVNIFTNGTLVTDDDINELMKYKSLLFSVSLDAIGSKHDELRQQEGAFDKSLNTLLKIKTKKGKKKYPLLEVKTVVLEDNLDDLPKLYKICLENDFDFISFSFARTTHFRQNPILQDNINDIMKQNYPITKYFDMEHFSEIYKELEALSKTGKTLLRWAPKFKPKGALGNIKYIFENGNMEINKLYKPCKYPFHDAIINPEGDIYPCLPIKMGSLKEEKLVDIINSEKYKKFRLELKERGVFSPCNLCCDLYPLKKNSL